MVNLNDFPQAWRHSIDNTRKKSYVPHIVESLGLKHDQYPGQTSVKFPDPSEPLELKKFIQRTAREWVNCGNNLTPDETKRAIGEHATFEKDVAWLSDTYGPTIWGRENRTCIEDPDTRSEPLNPTALYWDDDMDKTIIRFFIRKWLVLHAGTCLNNYTRQNSKRPTPYGVSRHPAVLDGEESDHDEKTSRDEEDDVVFLRSRPVPVHERANFGKAKPKTESKPHKRRKLVEYRDSESSCVSSKQTSKEPEVREEEGTQAAMGRQYVLAIGSSTKSVPQQNPVPRQDLVPRQDSVLQSDPVQRAEGEELSPSAITSLRNCMAEELLACMQPASLQEAKYTKLVETIIKLWPHVDYPQFQDHHSEEEADELDEVLCFWLELLQEHCAFRQETGFRGTRNEWKEAARKDARFPELMLRKTEEDPGFDGALFLTEKLTPVFLDMGQLHDLDLYTDRDLYTQLLNFHKEMLA